jgi:glycosyltransferase involved in cell wall biosynthesis
MSSAPRVSVITPAFNAGATLAQAVRSALAQTLADVEVLVVDDGSRQPAAGALVEISDRRLRVLRSEINRGVSVARNLGLRCAQAPLIAQLDADDLWRPDHLEGIIGAFEDPVIGLAYTNVEIIGTPLLDRAIAPRHAGDGLPEWVSDRALHPVDDLARLYRVNPIPSPSVVMRTEAVRAVGGYPRWLRVGEEYCVYLKLRRAGWHFAYVDRASAIYRWPEAGRGVSFDSRLAARQNLMLFVALMARAPGEPAIRRRVFAELANLIETHVPGSLAIARRAKRLAVR